MGPSSYMRLVDRNVVTRRTPVYVCVCVLFQSVVEPVRLTWSTWTLRLTQWINFDAKTVWAELVKSVLLAQGLLDLGSTPGKDRAYDIRHLVQSMRGKGTGVSWQTISLMHACSNRSASILLHILSSQCNALIQCRSDHLPSIGWQKLYNRL